MKHEILNFILVSVEEFGCDSDAYNANGQFVELNFIGAVEDSFVELQLRDVYASVWFGLKVKFDRFE